MRKINTRSFRVATRSTFREINRTIVLNLIREHQPISRAELARRMNVRRAALTLIVRELLDSSEVIETGTAVAARGRRPMLLRIRTSGRLAIAVDVRPTLTSLALADFGGTVLERDVFPTPARPEDLVRELGVRVQKLLAVDATTMNGTCHGIGVVVPGMVDRRGGRVLYAPRLGWRDVDLRDALATHVGIPVFVESAPIACALARLWTVTSDSRAVNNFAYVSVSDGVGVGIVVSGEVLRGEAHTAGEFGHVSLDPHGPLCACGKRGCWEAFACNSATSMRYIAEVSGGGAQGVRAGGRRGPLLAIEEIVRRAKRGERAAQVALAATGREIGRGLAAVVCAINPKRIYVAGEVTAAWDLLEAPLRAALVEGTLTTAARETPVIPDRAPGEYRLLGAIALVAAPNYAAPRVG
ncbi:MAG: ROK family protein [Gemmatimonadaceae bacterium]